MSPASFGERFRENGIISFLLLLVAAHCSEASGSVAASDFKTLPGVAVSDSGRALFVALFHSSADLAPPFKGASRPASALVQVF